MEQNHQIHTYRKIEHFFKEYFIQSQVQNYTLQK